MTQGKTGGGWRPQTRRRSLNREFHGVRYVRLVKKRTSKLRIFDPAVPKKRRSEGVACGIGHDIPVNVVGF